MNTPTIKNGYIYIDLKISTSITVKQQTTLLDNKTSRQQVSQ